MRKLKINGVWKNFEDVTSAELIAAILPNYASINANTVGKQDKLPEGEGYLKKDGGVFVLTAGAGGLTEEEAQALIDAQAEIQSAETVELIEEEKLPTLKERVTTLENLLNRVLVDLYIQGIKPKDQALITYLDTALETIKN